MTAYESIVRIRRRAELLAHAPRVLLTVAGILALAGVFQWGRSVGVEGEQERTFAHDHAAIAHLQIQVARHLDSAVKAAQRAHAADSIALVAATRARAQFVDARQRVAVVDDTTLRVDSAIVSTVPPVVNLIRRADELAARDSIALAAAHIDYVAKVAELGAMTADRDGWKTRAELDEKELERRKPSRFGFKAGATVATITILVLKAVF